MYNKGFLLKNEFGSFSNEPMKKKIKINSNYFKLIISF